jgi:hypothetical protein
MDSMNPKMTPYHFKMDIQLMDKLTDLELFQETECLSETIKRILLQLYAEIEKEDYKEKQRFSEYKLINDDKTLKRVNVIVILPDFLYRRLKSLHDVLNYYSMAQLVRDLLWLYLGIVDDCGEGYKDEIMHKANKWAKFSWHTHIIIKYIHQLLTNNGDMLEILKSYNVYNIIFAPKREFMIS